MQAIEYQPSLQPAWDQVLDRARNGLFQFRRGFVEYHADRFRELSYLFLRDGEPLGLVAGHRDGLDGWATHRGLTHGGIVAVAEARMPDIQEMFNALHSCLRQQAVAKVRYKPLPWWLQSLPSQEDLWLLTQLGARREAVWLNTLVPLATGQKVSSLRRRGAARARQAGLQVIEGDCWEGFWSLLAERLSSRHGVQPVHTLPEIQLLAHRFPHNIRIWAALEEGRVRAGIVGFLTDTSFHVQYSAADDRGRELGALDQIVINLMQQEWAGRRWLSFGTSCESAGTILNDGLLAWKEGFGGHGAVYEELSYNLPAAS